MWGSTSLLSTGEKLIHVLHQADQEGTPQEQTKRKEQIRAGRRRLEGTGSSERTKHSATFAYYLRQGSLDQVDDLVRPRALSIKRKNTKSIKTI